MGPETPEGRDFADRWHQPGFRHAFRVITGVWGVAFLAEAAIQALIVESASTGTAKTTSNLMPIAFAGLVVVWTVYYSRRSRRKGGCIQGRSRPGLRNADLLELQPRTLSPTLFGSINQPRIEGQTVQETRHLRAPASASPPKQYEVNCPTCSTALIST